MFARVARVRWIEGYILELGFTDGVEGRVDFGSRVTGRGGVFRDLEDVERFRQVRLDPEAGTIVWPNGVDFCPDVLYALVTGRAISAA
jgi:hypothetical protein